jgi:hypothetical protein
MRGAVVIWVMHARIDVLPRTHKDMASRHEAYGTDVLVCPLFVFISGEASPVTKAAGSPVSAGTVNVGGGTLLVLTTAAAGDSAVARMAALVEKVRVMFYVHLGVGKMVEVFT